MLAESAEGGHVHFTTVDAPPLPPPARHVAFRAAHAHVASASAAAPAAHLPREAKTEIVLTAPMQGAPSVPIERERTRRPRAPWEEGRGEKRHAPPPSEG